MSITFIVLDNELHFGTTYSISFDSFKELTGTKIDLEKRVGNTILVKRDKGHLYFYDDRFILGESYIYQREPYKCSYINSNGTALLSNKMHFITLSEPLAFRIA